MRFRRLEPLIGCPSRSICPETCRLAPLERILPARILRREVLPAPDGPISAHTSPPDSEPAMLCRMRFSFLPEPTVYPTSAHAKVELPVASFGPAFATAACASPPPAGSA